MGQHSRASDMDLLIDSPVGAHSEPREIHAWLDELERMRLELRGNAASLEQIDVEVARAIGWLRGRTELSGE